MMNPTSAAIISIYRSELKHMVHPKNIEDNEREIICPKIMDVPNTRVNGSSE